MRSLVSSIVTTFPPPRPPRALRDCLRSLRRYAPRPCALLCAPLPCCAPSLHVIDIVMYRPFAVAVFGLLSTVGDFVDYKRVNSLAPSTRRALGTFVSRPVIIIVDAFA